MDLLYHEATFLEDNIKTAEATFHSTARQAAAIALNAGVAKLLMGHFSSRYKDLELSLKEAREIFPESHIAREGMVIEIELKKN